MNLSIRSERKEDKCFKKGIIKVSLWEIMEQEDAEVKIIDKWTWIFWDCLNKIRA